MTPIQGGMTRISGAIEAARSALTDYFSEDGGATAGRDRLVMARALGSLFFAGGMIGLVSLVLPHSRGTNVGAIGALCAIALAAGFGFIFERGRLPRWAFPAACYGATLLIALALYYSDRPESPYSFYFVLVAMFSAYFLSSLQVVLQTISIAIAYPVVIGLVGGGGESAQRWLLTIWTVIVVAAFIAILRRRMNILIAKLSDAARTDPLTGLLNRRGFQDIFDL